MGQGAGDIYIKAECMSFIQIFVITDAYKYDNVSSDKSSEYTKSYVSLTYNSNGYYSIKNTGGDNFKYMQLTNGTFNTPCEISLDMQFVSSSSFNNQIMFGLLNTSNRGFGIRFIKGTNDDDDRIVLETLNGTTNNWSNIDNSVYMKTVSRNTWYHYVVKIESDKLTGSIYDSSNNLVATSNHSITATANGKFHVVKGYSNNSECYIKNILIKPL